MPLLHPRPLGLAVDGRLLDLSRHRLDLRIPDPSLALGVELGGLEPIEQLAEDIRVILKYLTHS